MTSGAQPWGLPEEADPRLDVQVVVKESHHRLPDMSNPMFRSLAAATALCASLVAQSNFDDLLWLGSDGKAIAYDRWTLMC